MEFLSYIYVIGAAQGVVLAIALLRKHANKLSNRILAIWLLLLAFDLAMRVAHLKDRQTSLLQAHTLVVFFPFLYGGFFYLYVRTLIKKIPLRWRDTLHAGGFIFMAGANIHWIIDPWHSGPRVFYYYELTLYLYSVSYVIAGLFLIYQYRRSLVQQESNTDGIELRWLVVMAYGQTIIWAVAISQWLIPIKAYNHLYIYVAVASWMAVMGYLALSQQSVQPLKNIDPPSTPESDERFPEVAARLESLMQERHIYRQPALNIGQLAKSSGYPEYLISLVINRVYKMSFREYINTLRIEEAKTTLADSSNTQTILDIAYDCGFTSKSTFNTAFKRISDMTPSAFKQAHASVSDLPQYAAKHHKSIN